MKREELLRSKDYVISQMQLNLLNLLGDYMKKNKLLQKDLGKQLDVSKGYISQILNTTYDHKLSKIAELALSCNAMPLLNFVDLDRFIKEDSEDKYYELMPMYRPRLMTFSENESYTLQQNITKSEDKFLLVPIQESKLEATSKE